MAVSKSSIFKLGTIGAPTTLTDLSSSTRDVKFPREVGMEESTNMGSSGARTFEPGLTGATISVELNHSTAVDAQMSDALGFATALSFEYGPETSATGKSKYTGSAFVTKYEPPVKVGSIIVVTVELQITSAVTRSTYA
jgi:hypothetical protein